MPLRPITTPEIGLPPLRADSLLTLDDLISRLQAIRATQSPHVATNVTEVGVTYLPALARAKPGEELRVIRLKTHQAI